MTPTAELIEDVERFLGKRSVRWDAPHTGLSPAQRFVVHFEDGSSVFVKAAVGDWTEAALRVDHQIVSTLGELVARVVGWIDAPPASVLLLENLHEAYWPADHVRADGTPVLWKPGQRELLIAALDRLAALPPPTQLSPLSEIYEPGWPAIDPARFLDLRLCSEAWLQRALPALIEAERCLDLAGDSLVHKDVRSDNVCFRGNQVILVDWSNARRGSPRFDLASFLGTGILEDGPEPYAILPDAGSFAAWRAARLAMRAQSDTEAPAWLIGVLARMAAGHLAWAAKCLDLPPPI